jgi:site-specific recombinase XerD
MLRNGAHPEMVRRFLGHGSMKTLAQYLDVTISDIRGTHAKSRPGG